jgi:hypothetical protein
LLIQAVDDFRTDGPSPILGISHLRDAGFIASQRAA